MMQGRAVPRFSLVILICFLAIGGCSDEDDPSEYVARVGNDYLMQSDVRRALTSLPVPQDSAVARQQIIERWVTNELLYQEAERRGLREDADVRRLLRESERSVLINALVAHFYEENEVTPAQAEMRSYFERNKDQLRLRENFARVRYLQAATREGAESARAAIDDASIAERDSIWADAIRRYAVDSSFAATLSRDFYPESRLFADKPRLHDALVALRDGQAAPVIESDSGFHVVQLAERVPASTIPEMEWIEDELARRLVINGRKQLYARQVQRLRNEALAREDLEVK